MDMDTPEALALVEEIVSIRHSAQRALEVLEPSGLRLPMATSVDDARAAVVEAGVQEWADKLEDTLRSIVAQTEAFSIADGRDLPLERVWRNAFKALPETAQRDVIRTLIESVEDASSIVLLGGTADHRSEAAWKLATCSGEFRLPEPIEREPSA